MEATRKLHNYGMKTITDELNMSANSALGRAKAGDQHAFDDLVRDLMPDIEKFVRARVEVSEVEDVLQDIRVASWKAVSQFDGRSRLRTWLFGIAIHKIKDHYRKVGRSPSSVEFIEGTVLGQPSKEIEQTELRQSVWSLAECLPENQLAVIDMYYRCGLTLNEIAELLGRNLNTVKYQFCQAHARMAKEARSEGWVNL